MKRFQLVLILVLFSVAPLASAEEEKRPKELKTSVVTQVTGKKALAQGLPDGRLFVDAQAFAAWWEQAGQDTEDLPEIDFEKMFISVEPRDAADPNRVRWGAMLDDKGEVEVVGMSTLMGYEPSDLVTLTFLAVPREDVKGLVRWEYGVDEDGKRVREKRVYELTPAEDVGE